MNWLALSPGEAAAVWTDWPRWRYGSICTIADRSTAGFHAALLGSVQPISQPRRRKLREPWALLAQVLFLLLLILALANPRWGVTFEGRSVVIVFDTSIWSQVRPAGGTPWIDRERAEAQRILNSLPAGDRVLTASRGNSDAPPILPFTTDRAALRRAVAGVQASSGTADVPELSKWAGQLWLVRGRDFSFTLGPGCSMRIRRAASTSFGRRSKSPETSASISCPARG